MNKLLKFTGVVIGSLVALAIIAWIGLIIFSPDVHSAFMHILPGVPQKQLPSGVTTSVVLDNVNVIPMDSERVLEGNTVVIENGRIADMGANGEVEIPVEITIECHVGERAIHRKITNSRSIVEGCPDKLTIIKAEPHSFAIGNADSINKAIRDAQRLATLQCYR